MERRDGGVIPSRRRRKGRPESKRLEELMVETKLPNHEVMLGNGGDTSQLLMSSIWLHRRSAVTFA